MLFQTRSQAIAFCGLLGAGIGFTLCSGPQIWACRVEGSAKHIHCTRTAPDCPPDRQGCATSPRPEASAAEVSASGGDIDTNVLAEVSALYQQVQNVLYPYAFSTEQVPDGVINNVNNLLAQADTLAGGDAASLLKDVAEAIGRDLYVPARIDPGNAPSYSLRYCAIISQQNQNVQFLRGFTGPFGEYQLFVPRGRANFFL